MLKERFARAFLGNLGCVLQNRFEMTSKKNKARAPKELNPKKFKKKTSVLVTDKIEYVDYKDVNLLARFVSSQATKEGRTSCC